MNLTLLIGRITKDIEVKTVNSTSVTRFTLAVDRMKNDEADFISCKAFGKTAELLGKYCGKGSLIAISGSIRTGSYESNGRKVYTTDVIADRVQFLSKRMEEADEHLPDAFTVAESLEQDELPF